MRRPLAIISIMALMLLASACASTGGGGQNNDEILLDCQAKADTVVKARYTPKWQAVVDQCVEEAQQQ